MTATLSWVREGRITGSRLPKILGLSPHGTRDDVLREMVREYFDAESEFKGNPATEYGTRHEADAISEYELTTGRRVQFAGAEQQLLMHPVYDFLAVTPDGLVDTDRVLEAKAPWRAPYTHVSQRPDIESQIRLQLDCAQREWGDLAVWREDSPIAISTIRYDEEWLPSVMPELEAFLAEYQQVIDATNWPDAPAPYLKPLIDQRDDEEFLARAHYYRECQYVLDVAQARRDEAKADVVEILGDTKSTRGGGLVISRSLPKGRLDYDALIKAECPLVDVELYRKESKDQPAFTIRLAKN